MKNTVIISMLLVLALFAMTSANVPGQINYQGRLTDAVGDVVADGAYLVKFSIYDQAVAGTELWNSGFQNITTVNGLFNYSLGSSIPFPGGMFQDTSLYLGITVGVDPELAPRTRLTTTPFAFHALRADTAAVSLSTVGATYTFDGGDVVTTGFLNLLESDSINCPDDGYVLVIATVGMNCNHSNGDEDVVFVSLTDSTATILSDQDGHVWALPNSLPSGFYGNPIHVHKIFPVSAGWNEFLVIGFHNPGGGTDNFASQDVSLSLLYVPLSFGGIGVGTKSNINQNFENIPLKE